MSTQAAASARQCYVWKAPHILLALRTRSALSKPDKPPATQRQPTHPNPLTHSPQVHATAAAALCNDVCALACCARAWLQALAPCCGGVGVVSHATRQLVRCGANSLCVTARRQAGGHDKCAHRYTPRRQWRELLVGWLCVWCGVCGCNVLPAPLSQCCCMHVSSSVFRAASLHTCRC